MILTIANTKGGVGKSTLAVNIAVERARLGKRVWLVDGDRQGSSQTAILIRSEAGLEPEQHVHIFLTAQFLGRRFYNRNLILMR